ncbi:GAF domain-containing protein [Pontibacter qinzhouensis]|uniref:histidine kinase n=1 Tax=Pontibacter qinzhouensis TaxID=2603253 RepID=A0A5C8J3Y1_9BACT|nr:ATP-binding protein [Pontibacter qinzhouensis]TXK29669.1 GAF domain-containing protein [Pontibacter qinzhouensis]
MQNYQNLTVDLSNCDTEPIHLIGRIQPHGFMIVLNLANFVVEQVSQNIASFIEGVYVEDLISHTLEKICFESEYPVLHAQLQASTVLNPQLMTIKGNQYFGFLQEAQGKLILECEPYHKTIDQIRFEHTYGFSNYQTALNNSHSMLVLSQLLVDFVQNILDYDRVMIYKFDNDWHGEVIAEKIKPGAVSYLHHHFPSTDIPAPARDLLEKKHVRQIPDIDAPAVDIYPYLNPTTGTPANVLLSELRNPSEIHLEYLHNMDAYATLSISIIVKGKLWGLVACQNQRPKFVNYWLRQSCNLAAKAFASAVLASQDLRDITVLERYKLTEENLINQVIEAGNIHKGLFEKAVNLLHITECSGAAMFLENKLEVMGVVPDQDQIMRLIKWLAVHNNERIFYSRELSKQFPEAEAYPEVASGLMALEISKYNREYILYFKPEIRDSIVWAGKPEKETDGYQLKPRKSFEQWVEVIKGKSQPWTMNELEVAQLLLKDIISLILRNQANKLKELNSNLVASAEDMQRKNQRLEDFAYIITHNLRSPMSNIKGLYNLYEAEPSQETGQEVMERMNVVIGNMSNTIDDLNTILRTALDQQLLQDEVHIADLIEKELQNLETAILEKKAIVVQELDVPVVHLPKVYMESLLHNLLSNAIKYSSPDRPPLVKVKSWQQNGDFFLSVSDNGLGLDMQRFGNKMFGLYNTFHDNKDAKGLGLYITKMQVESLGGTIEVESEAGIGTTFTVRFNSQQV